MPQFYQDANGTMHEFPDDVLPEEIDAATKDLPVALTKPQPKQSTQDLFNLARAGDQAARNAYNIRAQTYGQNTLEQDAEQNSPVAGQSFGQNMWQAYGRTPVELVRAFDSPEAVDRQRELDKPLMGTGGGIVGTIAGQGVMLAGPQAGATRGLAVTGKVAPYLAGATVGGVQGAVAPVGTGETRGGNSARSAVWGGAGQAIGDTVIKGGALLGKALTPKHIELLNIGKSLGIDLNPSQLTNSRYLKTLASQSKYWPMSGFNKSQEAQQVAFNRAVSNLLGESSDVVDDTVMSAAKVRQGQMYEKAFEGVTVTVDKKSLSALNALRAQLPKRLPADKREQFDAVVQSISDNINKGKIEGKVYQELRRELKSLQAENKDGFGRAVGDLRGILEATASRSVPKDKQFMLAEADKLTRNLGVVKKARTRVANANGDIAPTSLYSPTQGKYGATPEMMTLARFGQAIKDPIRDSGTAARSDQMTLVGAALMPPKAIVGRIANSPSTARAMVNAPKYIEGTSRRIGSTLPGFALRASALPIAKPDDKKKKKKP